MTWFWWNVFRNYVLVVEGGWTEWQQPYSETLHNSCWNWYLTESIATLQPVGWREIYNQLGWYSYRRVRGRDPANLESAGPKKPSLLNKPPTYRIHHTGRVKVKFTTGLCGNTTGETSLAPQPISTENHKNNTRHANISLYSLPQPRPIIISQTTNSRLIFTLLGKIPKPNL